MSADAPRRRRSRRVDAPGTGPVSADTDEPQLPETSEPAGEQPGGNGTSAGETKKARVRREAQLSERDRWLLEQRPPHWG